MRSRRCEASEQRLAAQSQALTSLTASHADPNDTFEHRLRGILEMAATTLHVERVSMWRFDDGRAGIECVGLFRRSAGGARIRRAAGARGGARVLRRHRTRAGDRRARRAGPIRARSELQRRRISSRSTSGAMLDVPLRRGSDVIGVLCAEHVGGPRVVDRRRAELRHLDREPDRASRSPTSAAAKR